MKTAQILTIISLSCLFISLVSSFLTKIPVVVKNVFFLVAVVLLATSQVVKCKPEELSEKQITTVDLKSLKRFSMNDNNSINKSKILGESKDLWDNYKDRKFMNDFYPHLSKFDTILDIGARNYNKRCKNLINSQSSHGRSTKYYQLEPFPGKYIDNDGLLKCFVQYSLIKYPEFQEFFDVVIDFGVLGWDQIKLSNKDIEIYLQNILGLLKPNGLYVLKVDSSSRKNFLNFCRFIEPYFNYTDFTGYKNGTLVDDDMRVYFLTKKHNISLSIPNDLIKDLVITAHPDDESIWVGEILGPLCAVILVTCENETRFNEFKQVMDKTGVKNWQILNFPDSKDHREETSLWKIKDLIPKVRKVMKSFPDLENIYTHNANGEYGHPDHKSVHQAVTAAYAQEYNLDDNKPENGVTDKQGYPNSGCTCTESSLRKSLIDIYDEKLKGTQSVQQFRNLCPRVRNISSQILKSQWKNHDYKISVLILSYNRPHNLEKSLPILNKYKLIDEIIVLHGHPKYYTNLKYDKVKNIKDYENNKIYGGARRWMGMQYLKNDIIMILDDDLYPSEKLVTDSYNLLMKNYNKNTIYGNFNRGCNQNGYFIKVTDKNYDSILTGQVMCKKKIIEDYMRNYFHKHEKWLIDNHGNCEDLGLNFFIRNFYKEKPVYVKGKIIELDRTKGYSFEPEHYKIRSNFCKKYHNV
jgi:hypothetical protein